MSDYQFRWKNGELEVRETRDGQHFWTNWTVVQNQDELDKLSKYILEKRVPHETSGKDEMTWKEHEEYLRRLDEPKPKKL